MRRSPAFVLYGLAALMFGCGPKPVPPTQPTSGPVPAIPAPAPVTPPPEARDYWSYDGGHFAKGTRDEWFEHNAEAAASRQGRWEFREVARTAEYVELYDASRAVQLRLTESEMLARWDKDGKDAPWKSLKQGKWGRE